MTDTEEGPYAGAHPFRPARRDPLLQRTVPVAKELPGYRPHTARRDLTAALTVAALAVPSAMAYAELAGLELRGYPTVRAAVESPELGDVG